MLTKTEQERDHARCLAKDLKGELGQVKTDMAARVDAARAEGARDAEESLKELESSRDKTLAGRLLALGNVLASKYRWVVHMLKLLKGLLLLTELSGLAAGALGLGADQYAPPSEIQLESVIGAAEGFASKLTTVLSSSTAALAALHRLVLPKQEVHQDLAALAETFRPEGDSFPKFIREQTVCGSATAFKMLLGHGVALDLGSLVSALPVDSAGKKVSLSQHEVEARRLANALLATFEQRVAKRKKKGSASTSSAPSTK